MDGIPTVLSNSPECAKAAEKARQKLLDSLINHGIDSEYLAEKLKKELEADETKVFCGKDGIVYSEPLIAWKVRQEARKDAHKLLDHYPHGDLDFDERPILVIMPKIKKEVAE